MRLLPRLIPIARAVACAACLAIPVCLTRADGVELPWSERFRVSLAEGRPLDTAMALLEKGQAQAASRFLRRALEQDPALISSPPGLRSILGVRWQPVATKIADELKRFPTADSYFTYGVFRLWSGEREEAVNSLRMADLLAGGDALALKLVGEDVSRSFLRAKESLSARRCHAALADIAAALSEKPSPEIRGAYAALLLACGYNESAGHEFRALLRPDPTAPISGVPPIPDTQSPWWALDAIMGSLNTVEPSLALIIGNALAGQSENAGNIANELFESKKLTRDEYDAMSAWIAHCASLGPHPKAAEYAHVLGPPPAYERVATMLRQKDFDGAARMLSRLRTAEGETPDLYIYTAALMLAREKDGEAAQALGLWVSALGDEAQLAPSLASLVGDDAVAAAESRLSGKLAARPEDFEARYALVVLGMQLSRDYVREHLDNLAVMLGNDKPAVAKLLARMPAISENPPETNAESAEDLLRLGDAAFANGSFELANKRYLQAGQRNENLGGLTAALLRGAFAIGDYPAAAKYALKLLDNAKITGVEKARTFSSGTLDAYRLKKDFDTHLGALSTWCDEHAVSPEPWLLCGLLLIEAGKPANAIPYLSGYQKIAFPPRADASFFLAHAQREAR
ncbi:MAG: hypothetical protein L6Q71_00560 [Planctomycetes bacterium]|nr:hypothetical protein [Planctomycetota bacterium]